MEQVLPREVFSVFGIAISDTVVSTWIVMAVVIGLVALARWRFPMVLETLIRFLDDAFSDVMERPAGPYLPFLGALIIFITVANVIGVVPIVTTPTRDINTPAALAIVSFVAVHIFGLIEKGPWRHAKDMASPLYLAPLMFPLEIVGQLSRTLSLALRLFGNIVSSELIVVVVFSMIPPVAPLPMIALGLFTGVLQAYIFTTLTTVFIGMAVKQNK